MKNSLSSKNFSCVYNNSFIIKTPKIVYRLASFEGGPGLGFVLTSRLGAAWKRNFFKRRARNLYRLFFISQHKKFGVIIRPETINLSWVEMKESFELLLKKTNHV